MLLLIGAVALVGETAIQAVYTPDVLVRLVVLAGVALAGLALGGAWCRPPSWAIALSVLLGVRALAVAPPLDNVIANDRLLTGVLVLAAATAVPAMLPLVQAAPRVTAVALIVAAIGHGLVVLGGPPVIDVWVLLQGAGEGLAGGHNPYELAFPAVPAGQTGHCFTYLPATALLTAPGVWLGDARWAELVALMAAAALLAWRSAARGGARPALAVLVVGAPLVVPMMALIFLASFVPVVGALVSGVIAVLVVLVTKGPVAALIVLGVVIGVQQLEGNVLQPLLLGRAVELSGVAVVLAVAVGSVTAGIT
ncbi:MAG: AI-2E family transporter, partial [Actinobacteria bacterium]|nr:AI-2E family transporter [Actinomycetota bacterium]